MCEVVILEKCVSGEDENDTLHEGDLLPIYTQIMSVRQ